VNRRFLLSTLLTLSGFCGISYEILYGRVLGNIVGDQFSVSATVLLTFLLGIAAGTLFAYRLWRALWAIEAGIGISGVLVALGSGELDALLYRGGGGGPIASVVSCFAVLMTPAFLIGCTVPLFAGYRARLDEGARFSSSYWVYNFGAAATALVSELVLVRTFGVACTILAIAGINGIVSACLFFAFRDLRAAGPLPKKEAERSAPIGRGDLAALSLASVASAVFQLSIIKLSESFLGPFRETFALVLAVVLLGIAAGTVAVAKLRLRLHHLLVAIVLALAWVIAAYRPITAIYAELYPAASGGDVFTAMLELGALIALVGPAVAAFGSTVPALVTGEDEISKASGRLLFVSSVSNAVGFLAMVSVLHQTFDYGELLLIIAAIAGAAILALRNVPRRWSLGAAAALILVASVKIPLWNEDLVYLGHTAFHSPEELASSLERHTRREVFKQNDDSFAINWSNGRPYFYINGYISCPLRTPAETIVGAYASIFSPRFDDALVLGVGSGSTAGAVSLLFDRTDGVEINRAVLDHLDRLDEFNFRIEKNPRVTLVNDDAIHFMKAADRTYSMILNTVTSPLYFSSSKLYTHEFFESVKKRLRTDGIYVTWFDSRVGDKGADIILNTLSRSFASCSLGAVKSSYFLLICSDAPVVARQPFAIGRQAELGRYLLTKYRVVPEWIPYGTLTRRAFDLLGDHGAPINTLDHPVLEFHMGRLKARSIEAFKERVKAAIDPEDLIQSAGPNTNPVHLALHQRTCLGDSMLADHIERLLRARVPDFDRMLDQEDLRRRQFFAARLSLRGH
jgi:spermidine synthase